MSIGTRVIDGLIDAMMHASMLKKKPRKTKNKALKIEARSTASTTGSNGID